MTPTKQTLRQMARLKTALLDAVGGALLQTAQDDQPAAAGAKVDRPSAGKAAPSGGQAPAGGDAAVRTSR